MIKFIIPYPSFFIFLPVILFARHPTDESRRSNKKKNEKKIKKERGDKKINSIIKNITTYIYNEIET